MCYLPEDENNFNKYELRGTRFVWLNKAWRIVVEMGVDFSVNNTRICATHIHVHKHK